MTKITQLSDVEVQIPLNVFNCKVELDQKNLCAHLLLKPFFFFFFKHIAQGVNMILHIIRLLSIISVFVVHVTALTEKPVNLHSETALLSATWRNAALHPPSPTSLILSTAPAWNIYTLFFLSSFKCPDETICVLRWAFENDNWRKRNYIAQVVTLPQHANSSWRVLFLHPPVMCNINHTLSVFGLHSGWWGWTCP